MNPVVKYIFLLVSLLATACSSVYYDAMENVGIEKRDILVDRVGDAKDAQGEASEQFASALEQFKSVVEYDGGDIEVLYDRLNREYERSVADADEVRNHINSVEKVAEDLFDEWNAEIEEFSSTEMKRNSSRLLTDTRQRYAQLLKAMRKAEATMDPVLEAFQDQVLVLKHNLNARAIGALKNELVSIERDTARLIDEMQKSILEAEKFIQSMEK